MGKVIQFPRKHRRQYVFTGRYRVTFGKDEFELCNTQTGFRFWVGKSVACLVTEATENE